IGIDQITTTHTKTSVEPPAPTPSPRIFCRSPPSCSALAASPQARIDICATHGQSPNQKLCRLRCDQALLAVTFHQPTVPAALSGSVVAPKMEAAESNKRQNPRENLRSAKLLCTI